jgi:hypothetical protein
MPGRQVFNAMAIQLSIVRIGALKRRQKHRWKESNPRGAGLESGLLPKLTDIVREIKEPPWSVVPDGRLLRESTDHTGGPP